MSLYNDAVALWGDSLPVQISSLTDKSDESVFSALSMVIHDMASPNWASDARVAWMIMTRRT